MTTIIILYNHHTNQYYLRLHPGVVEDDEKSKLLESMQAVNAGEYDYSSYPQNCNRLYFQEFDTIDTAGVYYNINGDRPVYDIIQNYGRQIEYYI